MELKKWMRLFLCVCLVVAGLYALGNSLVDPFGVFGDRLFNWYSYDMTENPRVAKIAYLEKNHQNYDSYVIGSSKVSSLSGEELGKYMGGSFYNMTWYGGKLGDEYDDFNYLVDHYEVKNVVLLLNPYDTQDFRTESSDLKERMHCLVTGKSKLEFYFSYLFCNPTYAKEKISAWVHRGYLMDASAVYNEKTGSYNKQRRDTEAISDTASYLQRDGTYFQPMKDIDGMPYLDQGMELLASMKETCREKNIRLVVLVTPLYEEELRAFGRQQLSEYLGRVAEVTDYWNFCTLSSVTQDARYFYDEQHFRNAVGTMALARVFGSSSVFVPDDFGAYVTKENAAQTLSDTALFGSGDTTAQNSENVPILMYHSVTEDPSAVSDMAISLDSFKKQMQTLRDNGYHTVGYDDLYAYVTQGKALPAKPVVITFDDGYEDNLTLAAPVLQACGFQAQLSVIGCSVGKTTYKDSGTPITPHFSYAEVQPWIDAGVFHIYSHSYDMHQVESLDGAGCRKGLIELPGESEDDFIAAVRADYARAQQALAAVRDPKKATVYTYPYGTHSELTEVLLRELGTDITVTTDSGVAQLVRGLPQSLRALKRLEISDGVSGQALLQMMQTPG